MMLDSLLIRNFRLFQNIEIDRLSRVNLVVGKNNSGKSAMLEAIRLFVSSADPVVLNQIIRSRQELRRRSGTEEADPYLVHDIRHIFYGRKLPDLDQEGLCVGPLHHVEKQIHLTTAAYRRERSGEVFSISRVNAADASDSKLFELDDLSIYLVLENGSDARRLLNLSGPDRYRWPPASGLRPGQGYNAQIVPSRDPDSRRIATLWDAVSLTDLEREVVTGVQLVDPDIEDIAFIEDADRPTREARVPMARHKVSLEPLPLNSMGDGVARLFHIVLALANSRKGTLLVDEFENGLHWTVQPKVWEIVFRLATELDVQVFASTHSKDCVKSFGEIWQQQEDAGSLHRLNIVDGGVSVTPYTCETLMDSLDTNVEIR